MERRSSNIDVLLLLPTDDGWRSNQLYKIIGTFTVLCYGTGELKVVGVFDLQLKHYLGIIMGFYYKLSIVVYWELSASFGNRKGGIISRWRGGGLKGRHEIGWIGDWLLWLLKEI